MEIVPFRDFGQYPVLLWLVLVAFLILVIDAARNYKKPWSKPALAIYVTLFLWYPGNFIYVGTQFFRYRFSDETIKMACMQVLVTLIVFRAFLPWLTKFIKPKAIPKGYKTPPLHEQIGPLLFVVFFVWLILFVIAWAILKEDILGVIWPLSSRNKVVVFVHRGIGQQWDFLTAIGQYMYQLCAIFFGVAAVLSKGWLRAFAIALILVTWPYYMLGRIRNTQLSLVASMITAFILLAKARPWVKLSAVIVSLLSLHAWFLIVIDYRTDYNLERFKSYFVNHRGQVLTGFHYGLEMMDELCYINSFIESGKMKVTYGMDYVAETLNVIPRAIWPNKPRLGYEYLMARGMSTTQVRGQEMEIHATIAPGVIGQGLLNFGIYLGAPIAGFLLSLWAAYLAKLWQERWHLGKAFLMLLGLGLTFNLGRSISLLVLWPFVLGVVLVWVYNKVIVVQPIKYSRLSARQRASKS